jgi:hypothetical protein
MSLNVLPLTKGRCTKSVYVSRAVRTWTLRTLPPLALRLVALLSHQVSQT